MGVKMDSIDKEFLLKIFRQDPWAIEYAREDLKNDKDLVLEAVKNNGLMLQFASDELRNDREVVLEAIKQNSLSINYVGKELRNDKELVKIRVLMSKWYGNNDGQLFNLDKFLYIDRNGRYLQGYFQQVDDEEGREFIVFDELESAEEAELCLRKIERMLGC